MHIRRKCKQLRQQVCSQAHSFIHQYSALEAGLAGTRAQSCDRYGSGTLHPGHVLGGSLPLLSPELGTYHWYNFNRTVYNFALQISVTCFRSSAIIQDALFHTRPINAGPTFQGVLLDFLKFIITTIFCLATIADCQTSSRRSVRLNVGTASG